MVRLLISGRTLLGFRLNSLLQLIFLMARRSGCMTLVGFDGGRRLWFDWRPPEYLHDENLLTAEMSTGSVVCGLDRTDDASLKINNELYISIVIRYGMILLISAYNEHTMN